ALVYRFTGVTDSVIGSPVAGRPHDSLEDQIGFYINTLVLRDVIDGNHSFKELFEQVKKTTLDAYDHQLYPFDSLVEDLDLTHDTSRNAVFGLMFILQNARDMEEARFDTSRVDDVVVERSKTSKFDLTFNLTEVGSWISLRAEYNTDVYERTTIERFIKAYKQLLRSIVASPDTRVSRVAIISDEEKERVLQTFNDTKVSYGDQTYLELFAHHAKETPEAVAVVAGGNQFAYKELNEKSNQLARLLMQHGVGPDVLVPIYIERSFEMIVAILAILKAGGAYVPIDPDFPEERTKFVLSEIEASFVLTSPSLLAQIPDNFEGWALTDALLDGISSESIALETAQDQLAYVIYTSGTTGKPKGVMNEHGGLLNRLHWMKDDLQVDQESVFLQKTPYTFDVSVWELLLPFMLGARLIIAKPEGHKDPFYLQELMNQEQISVVHFVPSMLQVFVDAREQSMPSLRHVVCSGEALPADLLARFRDTLPEVSIHNYYGPTEAAIDVTAINLSNTTLSHQVSIGYPVPNTAIYIVNDQLLPTPVGVVGELLIGGVQVARGYLKRQELTDEKFIANPFKENERLYRTGDLASWNEDGSINYKGRMDDQVKIRGNRIELSEISAVLGKHPLIKSAIALVHKQQEEPAIAAYYVSTTQLDKKELQAFVRGRLPEYMVPYFWVALEQIPVTANGKLDRKSLPKVNETHLIQEKYLAPETEEERILASVWEQILQKSPVGRKDSFFNLGGDSIKSIQVVAKLKQHDFTLKVEEVLRFPVLEDMAKHLEVETREIAQGMVEGEVLLTPVQHRFFQKYQEHHYFNQAVVLQSHASIDAALLSQAMETLVNHHDALRMQFVPDESGWKQTNNSNNKSSFRLTSHDLLDSDNPEVQMAAIGQEMQEGLHLTNGPLIQVGHFVLPETEYVVLIVHHLVMDGISWRILLEDLSQVYLQLQQGNVPKLPSKTSSYQSWASALALYAKSDILAGEIEYWQQELDRELTVLPQKTAEDNFSNEYASIAIKLSKDLTSKSQTSAHQAYGTDMNDLLLTALGMAMTEELQLGAFTVEMEGHGREDFDPDIDVSRTVGWFTSMYPFVLDTPASEAIDNLIHVKEALRKIPNKGMGYGVLRYLGDLVVSEVLITMVFNYLGDLGDGVSSEENDIFEYASANIGSYRHQKNSEGTPISVSAMILAGELSLTLNYLESFIDTATAEQIGQRVERYLTRLIEDLAQHTVPKLTPSDLTYKGLSIAQLEAINENNNVQDVYRLSPLQQGIYFTWMSNASPFLYFEQTTYRLRAENLNITHLETAYKKLIERYDVLRTSFTNRWDGLHQIVWKEVPIHFKHTTIVEHTTDEEAAETIQTIKTNDRARGFDLESPSQMRLHVIELGEDRYEFVWSHHHILMDGWCFGILFHDFFQLLEAESSPSAITLEKPPRYAEYIRWLDSIDTASSKTYWKQYLDGYSEINQLPTQPTSTTLYDEKEQSFEIEGSDFEKITQFCADVGITLNVFVQGIWALLLGKYNQQRDIVFGLVVSGRPAHLEAVDKMIGLFINTIPVRLRYEAGEKAATVFQRMHAEAIDGNPHHYLNISEVVSQNELGNQLIDHVMVFKDYLKQDTLTGDSDTSSTGIEIEEAGILEQNNFEFNIEVIPNPDSLRVEFNYNRYTYDGRFIAQLLNHFKHLAIAVVEHQEQPLDAISYMAPEETNALIGTLHGETVEYPFETALELFSKKVAAQP
ncbi:MAG: amino acid adenylation domain-containing protein, partial [Bacteroidota bacterium]